MRQTFVIYGDIDFSITLLCQCGKKIIYNSTTQQYDDHIHKRDNSFFIICPKDI